ncbi:MAG: hypothetical protein J7L25_00925 [Deltaproteobacteria bacterium]|nr:hypothetical protein [Candidatus Tharpella aukensis]
MYKKIMMLVVVAFVTGLLVIPSMAKDHGNNNGKVDSPGKSGVAHQHANNAPADLDDIRNNHSMDKFASGEKGPSGPAGKSNVGHLYLYEKAPDSDATREDPWLIVEGGMWGKLKYNLSGPTFDFVFNGHGLPIGQEFTLIYYPDPWPANGLICLGSGIVVEDEDGAGSIHLEGSVDTGDLPIISDENYKEDGSGGAKIFLVPTSDVDCVNQVMVHWSGDDANLYEVALITFDDTDTDVVEGKPFMTKEKGKSGQAGKSNIGHLYLYEKTDDGSDDWPIVDGGAWGKMKYNLSGPEFNFVFNGHGLPIGQDYTLIYYPDPWPANGLICLGSGIVVEDEYVEGVGNVHIKGSVETGDLPIESDYNYSDGAKIFLVPTDDVVCGDQGTMVGWHGELNLYEGAFITFDDTDE